MRTYLRLLGYLRPYRLRFSMALACMVIYALMSAMALGMISPFMQVLFERVGQEPARSVALPGPAAPPPALELAREPLRVDNLGRWGELIRRAPGARC